MLEAVARAFEVDVATSKATCIDLLRANEFDVMVACERLTDGSGLELLGQAAKRWPSMVRILAIEPGRQALLRGKLGPFKLSDTISYPIEEEQLEAALERAGAKESRGVGRRTPARSPRPATARPAQSQTRARAPTPATPSRTAPPMPQFPPSKFVPLGTPSDAEFRILPHDYIESEGPLARRAQRLHPEPKPTLHGKAAAIAAGAVAAIHAAVSRYINPSGAKRIAPAPPPPRKKR